MRALGKATAPAEHPPVDTAVKGAFQHLCKGYDQDHGGFGLAPKFPKAGRCLNLTEAIISVDLNFILHVMGWGNPGEKKVAKSMLEHTLKAMSLGGIHDHIGKGFHRYSVDDEWHVPHFEKMLYDQTQLLAVYSDYSIFTEGTFNHIVRDIADYMIQFLRHPVGFMLAIWLQEIRVLAMVESNPQNFQEGGFYAAEDADSLPTIDAANKKEGAFCVWTNSEVEQLLKDVPPVRGHPAVAVFCDFYDIRENGNVPHIYVGFFNFSEREIV